MKQEQVIEIAGRAAKATPGPWDVCHANLVRAVKGDWAVPIFTSEAPIDWHKKKNLTNKVMCQAYADEVNNASFIAHARTDVPALIEEIKRLQDAIKDLVSRGNAHLSK